MRPALAEKRVNLTACHASALALWFSDMIPSFFLYKMIPYKKEQKDFPSITQIAPKGEHLHPFPRRDIITMEIFKIARNRAALSFFWGKAAEERLPSCRE